MSAPPASTLRETFTFICTALTEIGLSDLTPEVLRQATQEAYAVRQSLTNCSNETVNVTFIVAQSCQLLKNVHSLLVLALAQFPQNPRPQLKRYWEQVACEHVCSNVPATGKRCNEHSYAKTQCANGDPQKGVASAGLHFICSQLLEKGYPRASVLASSADCSGRQAWHLTC